MKKILIFLIMVGGMVVGGIITAMLGVGGLGGVLGNAEAVALDGSAESLGGSAEATFDGLPEYYIKAVNPGYTVDGVQNVGEMIEIGRRGSDEMVSLAGLAIGYTNSSGNNTVLVDLSKYIWTTGETFLIRLASSPQSELANLQYTKTLALKAGPLTLTLDGEVIDSVCWTGKDVCYAGFSSSKPTSLVRNLITGEFGHVSNYEPDYREGTLKLVEEEADGSASQISANLGDSDGPAQCKGVEFSEILSYYEVLQSEQFVELHNTGVETVILDGCTIKYKNKYYPLHGRVGADGYFVREATDFKLTKNPTTSNTLELVDANGEILDTLVYPNGQRKGTSYALIGYDEKGEEIWKVTYAPTPGEPNNYQEYRTCEEGKVINEATGNCVKVTSVAEKICGEGQYLNILTGRCKKIPETTETVCKEGYYLNPDTGRCKKIQDNTGADYALVPETYSESSSFVALWLVLGVVGVGLLYVGYEFRHEMMKWVRRLKWW